MADRRTPAYLPDLVEAAASALKTYPALVMSATREAPAARARQVVAYVLREDGLSLPHIGALLGRDHSTVHHAITKVDGDPQLLILAVALTQAHLPSRAA